MQRSKQNERTDERLEMKRGLGCNKWGQREQGEERSERRINGCRTIGHCIEHTWTADEVFTAARSSLCISYSAHHTAPRSRATRHKYYRYYTIHLSALTLVGVGHCGKTQESENSSSEEQQEP